MTNGKPEGDVPQQPTFRQLLDWVEGRLETEEAEKIKTLVDGGSEETRRSVEWIEGFLGLAREHPIPTPPPVLRQRLRQSFKRHHGQVGNVERQHAALSFDSRREPALAGTRSDSDNQSGYWLAFEAGSTTVVVDLSTEPEGTWRIDGQVLAAESDAPIWQAAVEHPAGRTSSLDGDDIGFFTLDAVPGDATKLIVSNGLMEIEIANPLGTLER